MQQLLLCGLCSSAVFAPVIHYRQAEAASYQNHPLAHHLLIFADEQASSSAALLGALGRAAVRDGHRVQHIWVAASEQIPVTYFDLHARDLPACFMYNNRRDEKYRLEDTDVATLTAEGMGTFTDDFLAGTVPLYVKSEPIPAAAPQPAVETVVGRNLAKRVEASDALVVMFYKETCPYSEEFLPIYEQLGGIVQAAGHTLVVAKGNVDRNEFRWTNFRLERFPTVYLFASPHKDNPVDFQAWAQSNKHTERSKEGLLAFLEAHGVGVAVREEL